MKRIVSILFAALFAAPLYAVDWWLMPTICQPANVTCYSSMGAGFEPEEWDAGGGCKGKKIICPNAVIDGNSGPAAFSKSEIADSDIINDDFDVAALDNQNNCFGTRKTRNNGTNAKVGSEWRNVYCNGVLDSPDEVMATGEIMLNEPDQPRCGDLAMNGYIGVLNGQCYGKFGYPESDFYLECGEDLLPKKIVVLNGAGDYRVSNAADPSPSAYPVTEDAAEAMFEKMVENAAEQQRAHAKRAEEEE